ncbi:MAG: hypothetical protein B1H03_04020 [Planctomycetales bacterium 4484_113]|nr:MAG: hypothetical protein B1H03_04020 [Planctomycetales bacterium 4484_113]
MVAGGELRHHSPKGRLQLDRRRKSRKDDIARPSHESETCIIERGLHGKEHLSCISFGNGQLEVSEKLWQLAEPTA